MSRAVEAGQGRARVSCRNAGKMSWRRWISSGRPNFSRNVGTGVFLGGLAGPTYDATMATACTDRSLARRQETSVELLTTGRGIGRPEEGKEGRRGQVAWTGQLEGGDY